MSAAAAGGPSDRLRVPARRPRVVLIDVFETMLRVEALRAPVRRRRPPGARVGAVLHPHPARRDGADPGRRGAPVRRGGPGRAAHHRPGTSCPRTRSTTCWRGFRELPPHPGRGAGAEALVAGPGAGLRVHPRHRRRWPAPRWTGPACAPTCAACSSTEEIRRVQAAGPGLPLGLPAGGRAGRPGGAGRRALLGRARRGAGRPGRRAGHPAGGRGARRGGRARTSRRRLDEVVDELLALPA